jgi:hypothetical protein
MNLGQKQKLILTLVMLSALAGFILSAWPLVFTSKPPVKLPPMAQTPLPAAQNVPLKMALPPAPPKPMPAAQPAPLKMILPPAPQKPAAQNVPLKIALPPAPQKPAPAVSAVKTTLVVPPRPAVKKPSFLSKIAGFFSFLSPAKKPAPAPALKIVMPSTAEAKKLPAVPAVKPVSAAPPAPETKKLPPPAVVKVVPIAPPTPEAKKLPAPAPAPAAVAVQPKTAEAESTDIFEITMPGKEVDLVDPFALRVAVRTRQEEEEDRQAAVARAAALAANPETVKQVAPLELQGVWVEAGTKAAFISDQSLRIGDTIQGWRLVSIGKDRVVLTRGGSTKILRLEER